MEIAEKGPQRARQLRPAASLFAACAIAYTTCFAADAEDDVHFRLQGGVCAIASPRQYNIAARLEAVSGTR